jgi:hypothetical protein
MKTFFIIIFIVLILAAFAYLYNTIGGTNFKADIDGKAFRPNKMNAAYSSGRLHIFAVYIYKDTTLMTIDLNASKEGTYALNEDNMETGNVGAYLTREVSFSTNSRYTGSVTITELDLDNKKVSGTFEFNAVQIYPPGSKVIKFTDGELKNFPIK